MWMTSETIQLRIFGLPLHCFLAWNVKIFETVLFLEWSGFTGGSSDSPGIWAGDLWVVLVLVLDPLVPPPHPPGWSPCSCRGLPGCGSHLPSFLARPHRNRILSLWHRLISAPGRTLKDPISACCGRRSQLLNLDKSAPCAPSRASLGHDLPRQPHLVLWSPSEGDLCVHPPVPLLVSRMTTVFPFCTAALFLSFMLTPPWAHPQADFRLCPLGSGLVALCSPRAAAYGHTEVWHWDFSSAPCCGHSPSTNL